MSRKGKNYPIPNVSRKSNSNIRNQKALPTEDNNLEQNDISVDQSSYQDIGTKKVPAEKTKGSRLADILRDWSTVLAGIAVISGFSIWGASLQFKVDNAENDVQDHKESITENGNKIRDIEKLNIGINRDVIYLKENQENIQVEIRDIKKKIDK